MVKAMKAARSDPSEIRALTGLRGVAAADVMLCHYNAPGFAILRFFEFHNAAVDLFFCLSAFTLCLAYGAGDERRVSWWNFAVARIARIYPLYFVTLVISFHLTYEISNGFAFYPPGRLIKDAIEQLLLVSNWPLIGHGVAWNLPAWSVSVETFCYAFLFFPLFAFSRAASRTGLSVRLSLVIALTFACYMSSALIFSAGTAHWGIDRPSAFLPYLGPSLRGMAMFLAGWLVYLSYRQKDVLSALAGVGTDAIGLSFLMIAVASQFGVFNRGQCLMLFPFLILGLAANTRSITARALASPPLHYLGKISYSVYLIHLLVSSELYNHGPDFFRLNDNRVWVESLITIGVASFSYALVEAPARRWLRHLLSRRSVASLPEITATAT
jgi:peptidoglycan/LPS O-acetylase OafA/YrhL